MLKTLLPVFILISLQLQAQEELTAALLEEQAIRFKLTDEYALPEDAGQTWREWIAEDQFVGLAEVHNSQQLSFFTTALLELLNDKGFEHFALELGPNSAAVLNEGTSTGVVVGARIKAINQQYGKNSIYKTPLIFVNKQADAVFMNKSEALGYSFWGLDQEYAFSFEMLFDRIFTFYPNPSSEQETQYREAKALLQKNIFKDKVKGQPVYCWYLSDPTLNSFLDGFAGTPEIDKLIADIRESWDIYCKSASGQGSNQQRANYMKKNFDENSAKTNNPKVLLKLGGVHLTHGKSPFGVNDIGMHLHNRVAENNSGFLSIRHLITYRNGKSNIGKSGWESVTMFLELGRKDQWTAVDLRPFRKQLQDGLITTTDKYSFELMSYDILLISPDDQYDRANY